MINRDNITGLKLRYAGDIARSKQYASDPLLAHGRPRTQTGNLDLRACLGLPVVRR